jgi:hypothetical protein
MDYFGTKIVMPSSLICQDYGEHPTEHGYCVWDIGDEVEYNFIDIPSDYGFYTFKINSIEDIENELETLRD